MSGISSAWLGVGGSLFIIPLLPLLSDLSPLESLQVSLVLIFTMSLVNSISFNLQRLVLWSWVVPGAITGLGFAYLSGFFVTYLSAFQIRFILWCFLGFILVLPLFINKFCWLQSKGIYVFSALMGLSSGLTGIGGGLVLSPYLHESRQMPLQNIPAVVSNIMFFVSSFSILGQISSIGFSFGQSSHWWFCFFLLLVPSIVGLCIGYYINLRQQNIKWRRIFLRSAVACMFVSMTVEIFQMFII